MHQKDEDCSATSFEILTFHIGTEPKYFERFPQTLNSVKMSSCLLSLLPDSPEPQKPSRWKLSRLIWLCKTF